MRVFELTFVFHRLPETFVLDFVFADFELEAGFDFLAAVSSSARTYVTPATSSKSDMAGRNMARTIL
jgi:hypothetical protein